MPIGRHADATVPDGMALGWAVVVEDKINIRTVAAQQHEAKRLWLVQDVRLEIGSTMPADRIDEMFNRHKGATQFRGEADVKQVSISLYVATE